jgi:ParB-like nuclease family protein
MSKRRIAMQSATTLANAARRAEGELRQPQENEARVFEVRPADIETRTELFQPRMLTHGGREVDPKHVRKLSKRIGNKGELEPVVVVNLNGRWVCVDGHHRLGAYAAQEWEGTIRANWFAGTVREAVGESLRLNEVDKLEMSPKDNFAAAWQRTVLGWGSAADVQRETNVSIRLARFMREVREAYNKNDEISARMRGALGRLEDSSWGAARAAYLALAPSPERSLQDKAATLSKQLTKKMTDFLSRDPEVTALALKIYDPDLPQPLAGHLMEHVKQVDDDDDEALELPTIPRAALLYMSDAQLMESLEQNQEARVYLSSKRVDLEREQDILKNLSYTSLLIRGRQPSARSSKEKHETSWLTGLSSCASAWPITEQASTSLLLNWGQTPAFRVTMPQVTLWGLVMNSPRCRLKCSCNRICTKSSEPIEL